MKQLLTALVLLAQLCALAQGPERTWDLLLQNKRAEARKQFEKDLRKNTAGNPEYLFLDALIDQQQGQLHFDESFLKKLAVCKDANNYIYPMWYYPFVQGNTGSEGFDDLTYSKIDYMAQADAFKDNLQVIYSKAIADRRRKDMTGFRTNISRLYPVAQWQFCGVFENMNGSGLYIDYEPETYAKNDKAFNANSNGLVNWYVPQIPQEEGVHFYYNEAEYGNGIMYAQTFIESDAARQVLLNFAASGPVKILLNDAEIYVNDKIVRSDIGAYRIGFALPKGMNRLLIKSEIKGGSDYIYASLRDMQNKPLEGIKYHHAYQEYAKAGAGDAAKEVLPDYEEFLQTRIKAQPTNVFYRLLLLDAYLTNHKREEAFPLIEQLSAQYPNSSLIMLRQVTYYQLMDDEQKVQELNKRMMVDDEGYYYSLILKVREKNWVSECNIAELEKFRDKAKLLKSNTYTLLYDFFIASRHEDVDRTLAKMEELIAGSHHNEFYITSFAPLYTSLKNDRQKTIAILEELIAKRENTSAINSLIGYYNAAGRTKDAQALADERIKAYPYFNTYYKDRIAMANQSSKYDESVRFADQCLKNFPYSFQMMAEKGTGYNYLKNTGEAEKLFRQSLHYNSGNNDLRKTLHTITKIPDEIDLVATRNVYDLIKQRRNPKKTIEQALVVLLDEFIINVLEPGAQKSKTTQVYEVKNDNGIEVLKEYSLDYADNILKAEVIKPDGSIVPGERNGGTVVFTGLQVNDVVYVEYESIATGYGRFYKDFNTSYYFNGNYPSLQTIVGVISDDATSYAHTIANDVIQAQTKKVNGKTFTWWEKKNAPAMPEEDSFSPGYDDLASQISISTIRKWSDISNWYADLVKKNTDLDNTALKAYNEIFPKGAAGLSQNDIAYSIYKYIEDNITYSSLDFRQSGYVPQRPSKTVTTRLGDCKDVSTLFVAMAQKAGLKANLVLVQTNEGGIQSIKLPAIAFNHCIVRTTIDGKDVFLELTNKYLPFRALPMSLYNAQALVISFDKAENERNSLINIKFDNAVKNVLSSKTVVTIEDTRKIYKSTNTVTGRAKSYYNELFSNVLTEEERKKEIEDYVNGKLDKVVKLSSARVVSNDKYAESMVYETEYSAAEKLQSVGSLKITTVPFLESAYSKDIVSGEARKYDIEYCDYENNNEYFAEVVLNIPAGRKFLEVPANLEVSYKGHKYSLVYEVVSPGSLKVTRKVTVPWDNITVAEYPAYKKYVEEIIAAEEAVIGFK